jgi:microcystin-dependent protein
MDDDAVLGEIRLWAGVFEPAGWTYCDGRVVSINTSPQEAALLAVIKSNFGGDGTTTFALPKLADIELPNNTRLRYIINFDGPSPTSGPAGLFTEVRIFPYTAPANYIECRGQWLSINWPQCNGQSVDVSANANAKTIINYRFGGSGDDMSTPDVPSLTSTNTTTVVPYIICMDGLLPTP